MYANKYGNYDLQKTTCASYAKSTEESAMNRNLFKQKSIWKNFGYADIVIVKINHTLVANRNTVILK